ncbi:MAG: aromatic ring-hydroxylating dioxygenase subunit alpha [Acidimicrobiales bacterium]
MLLLEGAAILEMATEWAGNDCLVRCGAGPCWGTVRASHPPRGRSSTTMTTTSSEPTARLIDEELTRRAVELVRTGTTDCAAAVLRVPLAYYRDGDVLGRERAEILEVTPLALVPTAQIPAAHDFVVREVLGRSVLVSRGDDGVARAFLNYCRHRGARPAEGCGNTRRHACPYHAWTYDSAGQLVGISGADGFTGIDPAQHGLVELPSEERHGFVWVVLTAGVGIDVAAHLGPMDDELGRWDYASYGYLTEREFPAAVNWKNGLEAFAEGYHFPYVHGQSVIGMNTVANTSTHDAFGLHHRLGFPLNSIAALAEDPGGDWNPRSQLGVIYWIFPNLVLANSPVGVEIIDILPGPDPVSCVVRHGWMATTPWDDEDGRSGYEAIYELVHAAVRDEDFTMLPSCGDGVRNAQHDHMLIGRNEIGVQHLIRTLAGRLGIDLGE